MGSYLNQGCKGNFEELRVLILYVDKTGLIERVSAI